ncbi:hypothetical protein EKO04_008803 [Ascochyta lentis]|uniref:Uncharacterized protein n=1 Tax=Ascochyta lentis TaxID=205686 RepID=A0A8H7IV53_9PLEO|nr:hypothetical protein EKO04_008803 [Ascochyta lentis]
MTVPLLSALSLLLVPAYSLNNATNINNSAAPKKVGWYDVSYRGTTTVLYSCLCTIFACTYTSLHLNVPSPRDSKWTKLLRKAKWMALTILFPEFAFAKAVCELQMAAADWCGLKAASDNKSFNWTFPRSKVIPIINKVFQFFIREQPLRSPIIEGKSRHEARKQRSATEQGPACTPPATSVKESKQDTGISHEASETANELFNASPACSLQFHQRKSQEWTLAHSYFANMGGFVLLQKTSGTYSFITGNGLLECCLPEGVNALSNVQLSKSELLDKAKADVIAKTVAIFQTFVLVLSVLTRVGRRLPISQLEICTVAFAALNFATYLSNLSKPKDVEIPVYITPTEDSHCNNFNHHGDCFVRQSLEPATSKYDRTHRIRNDELRTQGLSRQFSVLNWSLSLSTLLFGTIHCVAWFTDFPSETERLLWLIATVTSAVLPLVNLTLTAITRQILIRTARHRAIYMMFGSVPQQPPDLKGPWTPLGYGITVSVHTDRDASLAMIRQYKIWPLLNQTGETISQLYHNGAMDPKLPSLWQDLKTEYAIMKGNGLILDHNLDVLVAIPEGLSIFQCVHEDIRKTLKPIINALNDPRDLWTGHIAEQQQIRHTTDRLSTIYAAFTWFVYIVMRVTILALAFAALRSQDEGLYVATWTRNLPMVG